MTVSAIKRIGLGTTLEVRQSTSTAGGSTVFVTIGNIVEPPSGPDATATMVDTHTLDDGTYETKRKGSVDPGTGSMTILYDPEDTSGQILESLLSKVSCSAIPQWRTTLPACDGSTAQVRLFSAEVSGLSQTMPKNEMLQRTVTFQASGNPGFASTVFTT